MILLDNAVFSAGGFTLTATLEVPAGAICALIGPSGAGKSTLLNGLAGFAPQRAGRALIGAVDLAPLEPSDRPLTLLFQEHNLFPGLTAAENIGLGLSPGLRLAAADHARIAEALDAVGLEGLGERYPDALSGGQRQRVALARALLRERPALLLDEPFAALGPAQRAEMLGLVEQLARPRGIAVLMVTHDPADAARADLMAFCEADGHSGRVDGARPAKEALADPAPRSAAATAETDCEVVPVDANRFQFMVHHTPFFALQVMRIMTGRLRAMNARDRLTGDDDSS